MIKEALDFLFEMRRPETVKDEFNRQWSTNVLKPLEDSLPCPLNVHTLSAFLDWLASDDYGDVSGDTAPMIHVQNGTQVRLIGQLTDKWNRRAVYMEANPVKRELFPDHYFMEIEEFIIKLQCCFVESYMKTKIINLLSNVKGEDVQTAEDDGIAQTVVVENKMHRLEATEIEPLVTLQPFRTFLDIEQPECKYLLRMKRSKGSLPLVALFDADGGTWEGKAIDRISEFFRESDFVKKNKIVVIA